MQANTHLTPRTTSRRSPLSPPDAARPRRSALGTKTPSWMYGYGLFQGSVSSSDSLLLFFVAAQLSFSPALVGLTDATSNLTFAVGAVGLVFLLPHIRQSNAIFVFSILAAGLVLMLIAAVSSVLPLLILSLMLGLFEAPSTAIAPVMAANAVPQSLRSEAFSRLNRLSSLGGAIGISATVVWLVGADFLAARGLSMRLLFIVIGAIAVLAALYVKVYLQPGGRDLEPPPTRNVPQAGSKNPSRAIAPCPTRPPLLSDQLLYYLAFSFVLFAGLGMSFSGIHAFLIRDMRASAALGMGAVLGYKLASFLVSKPFGQGIAKHLPLQVQALAVLARGVAVAAVAVVGLLPGSLALPAIIALVTFWGISGAAIGVTGAEVTARLAVPGRLRESMALYVAVAQVGGIAGMWLGGVQATYLGFPSMFLLSAGLIVAAAILLFRS